MSARCQSGAGCDKPAVRGTFGLWWCEEHGAQLAKVAATFRGKRGPITTTKRKPAVAGEEVTMRSEQDAA